MMKIKADELVRYLNKLTLKNEIKTSLLDFTENGVIAKLQDSSNVCSVYAPLGKEHFDDYEAIGEVGINNNLIFVNILKRYKENRIGLVIDKNKLLTVTEHTSSHFPLTEKKDVDNHREKLSDLTSNFEHSFEIESDDLISIISGAETIGSEEIILSIKDNKLHLSTETDTGIKIDESIDVTAPDMKCKLGKLFFKVVGVLEGRVIMYLKSDYPAVIKCGNFQYTVAPRITPED